jgi:hypothetical protein
MANTTLPPIVISAKFGNLDEVKSAFQSLASAVQGIEKKMGDSTARTYKERGKKAHDAAREEARAAQQAAKETAKAHASQEKGYQTYLKQLDKFRKEDERKHAAHEAAKAKETLKHVKAAEKEKARFRKEQERTLSRASEHNQRHNARFWNNFSGGVGSSVGGLARSAMNLVGAATALGGGFTVANSLGGQLSAEKSAAYFSNATSGRIKRGEALAKANEISRSYGIESSTILEGMQSFVARAGDTKGHEAMGLADFVGKVSKAEGVDMKDLMTALGTASTQNEKLTTEDLKSMALNLAGQGKSGAVEIKDLAHVLAKTTATAAQFEGDQQSNQRKLAGLAQIAIKTTGSPEEAATAVERLGTDLVTKKDAWRARGINPITKDGKLRDMNTLLAEGVAKSGGAEGLHALFGERSGKLANALYAKYQDAESSQKGSGKQALLDYLDSIQKASLTTEQLDADFKTVATTSQERLDKAFNELKVSVGEKLAPEIERLLPELEKLIPQAAKLVDGFLKLANFVAENPLKSAFIALGAIILKEAGKAFASSIISSAIEKGLSKVNVSSIGVASGVAAIGITSAVLHVQDLEKGKKEGREQAENIRQNARSIEDDYRSGRITAEQRATALQDLENSAAAQDKKHNSVIDKIQNVSGYVSGTRLLEEIGIDPLGALGGRSFKSNAEEIGRAGEVSKERAGLHEQVLAAQRDAAKENGTHFGKAAADAFKNNMPQLPPPNTSPTPLTTDGGR